MTATEKLLMQIFERKNSIIERVKQQTELYSQHLASKLLIDGITPPSWLWNPSASTSDEKNSNELNKEELISKLLFPRQQPSYYPVYDKVVFRGDNEELSDRFFTENWAPSVKDHSVVPPLSSEDRAGCNLNCVPEPETSVTSPEKQPDERDLNIYNAPDQPLSGIQRSKSRQKALQLRNSGKTEARSDTVNKNILDASSSHIKFSLPPTNCVGQNDKPIKSTEPCVNGSQSCAERDEKVDSLSKEKEKNDSTCRISSSRSHSKVPDFVRGPLSLGCSFENFKENASLIPEVRRTQSMHISDSQKADDNYVNRRSKSAGPTTTIYCQNHGDTLVHGANLFDKGTDAFTDIITRSTSISSKCQSGVRDSSKAVISSSDDPMIDTAMMNDLPPDSVYGSPLDPSNVIIEGRDSRESISSDCRNHNSTVHVQSCSSNQQNASLDEVYDIEIHSHSAKADGSIPALSGKSAQEVDDSKEVHVFVKPSVGLSAAMSLTQSRDKELYEPVAYNEEVSDLEISSHSARVSGGILASSGKSPQQANDSNEGDWGGKRFRHAGLESWPQLKRRKNERNKTHSLTTSPNFRARKSQSTQRKLASTYLKNMEIKLDSDVDAFHVDNHTDIEISPEMTSNSVEGVELIFSSENGEVELCSKEKNEHKIPSSFINNEQLGSALDSSLKKDLIDSQGGFIEELGNTNSTSSHFDASKLGDVHHSQHLCNLEKDIDYTSTANLSPTNTMLDVIQPASHSVPSPRTKDRELIDVDQSMPEILGLNVDTQEDSDALNFAEYGIDYEKLKLPSNTIDRASFLAEICRSASLDKPSSHFPSAFEFQGIQNLHQPVPNDHLEHLDLSSSLSLNSDVGEQFQFGRSSVNGCSQALEGMPCSVSPAYSGTRYGWNLRSQYTPPVGRVWERERLSSYSGSSEKRLSSNPELTCFPIDEDASISEGNKTVDENEGYVQEVDSSLAKHSDKRKPLKDLSNLGLSPSMSGSAHEKTLTMDFVDFVSAKLSVTGAQDNIHPDTENQYMNNNETSEKQTSSIGLNPSMSAPAHETTLTTNFVDFVSAKLSASGAQDNIHSDTENQYMNNNETSEKQTSSIGGTDGRKNQSSLYGTIGNKKAKDSIKNSISKSSLSVKTGLRRQDQKLSLKDSRGNNIISNVSSFIPLIKQKQAATVCAGKKDIKVKALEAAEAAKRLEEKRENERKMKKEALKLERAKLEEKNLRQLELEKQQKEKERKKKDAIIIAKKTQREEEERNEKEKKRRRLEARQRQWGEEKSRAGKAEKEYRSYKDEQMKSKKELLTESKKQQNREVVRGDVALKKADTLLTTTNAVRNYEECGTSGQYNEVGKAMHAVDKSPRNEDLIANNSKGKSYEISPYQCSDDEEEDDVIPARKYIPSWASKSVVDLLIPLQQHTDTDTIFPPGSFCSTEEVLLPRK